MYTPQAIGDNPTVERYFNRAANGGLTCWYTGASNQLGHSTGAPTINNIYAVPIVLEGGVLDGIAFEVTTGGGAGSVGRCGLYANKTDGTFFPGSLVVDGGEFDCTSIAVKATNGLSVTIPAGLYWTVINTGVSSPTCRALQVAALGHMMGINIATSALYSRLIVASAYGALPATCPASSTFGSSPPMVVALHYAS